MSRWLITASGTNAREAINLDRVDRIEFNDSRQDASSLWQVVLFMRGREPLRIRDPEQMEAVRRHVEANQATSRAEEPVTPSSATERPTRRSPARDAPEPEEQAAPPAGMSGRTRPTRQTRTVARDDAVAEPAAPVRRTRRKAGEDAST